MDDADKFFRESPYNVIQVLLKFSGLWPFDTTTRRCATYLAFLLVLGTGLIFEVLGVLEVWSDFLKLVDTLPQLVLGILPLTKLVYTIHTLPQLKILLTTMQENWHSPKSDKEIRILQSYALDGQKVGYAYSGFMISNTIVYSCITLLSKFISTQSIANDSSSNIRSEPVELPYRANYMVDLDTYYIPIYIHTIACFMSYTILMVAFDVLYLTLVQHSCGLFAALRYRMESAFEFENDDELLSISTRDKISLNIVYSIRRHTEAIQFASITESIHRIPLLLHVAANVSLLSILGYQIITSTEDINRLLKPFCFFDALLINTFFENRQGQKIINSSEKVYESAYNTKWYKMPINGRKLIIMILLRSKEPIKITAGKFIIMSYITFSAIIRASSSYFMLLRSMQ